MERPKSDYSKWRLKCIEQKWFLDDGGILKRLDILTDSTGVSLKGNIIFTDGAYYQLIEESDGEIKIAEIKDVEQEDDYYKSRKDRVPMTKSNEAGATYEDYYSDSNINLYTRTKTRKRSVKKKIEPQKSDMEMGLSIERFRGFFNGVKQWFKRNSASNPGKQLFYENRPHVANCSNKTDDDYEELVSFSTADSVSGSRMVSTSFDFETFSHDEISFKKLDKLKIRPDKTSHDSKWCYVEHLSTGKKGFVPLAYLTEATHSLISKDWWHDISRFAAEELMTHLENPVAGTFLIRPSGNRKEYALSMLITEKDGTSLRIVHYVIKSREGQYYLSNEGKYEDISSLVDNYKRSAGILPCKLMNAVPKQAPVVYPRSIDVSRCCIKLMKPLEVGHFGDIFAGKMFNAFDVTVVTNCMSKLEQFRRDANIPFEFRQSKHFVRMIAVILEPEPFMIVLGDTVQDTLQNFLRKDYGKTLSFKNLTKMASEVAYGMAYLEEKGIVHGHLKAENVFICEYRKVKIVHPKLIELMQTSKNDKHVKGGNEWQWTAPEVLANESAKSVKSDVWSFGVVMYELITFGKMPYEDFEKDVAIQGLSIRRRLTITGDGPVQCPDEYYHTMLQCWHANPDRRLTFDFLGEFLNDYENAVTHAFKGITRSSSLSSGTLKRHQKPSKNVDESVDHSYVNIGPLTCLGKEISQSQWDENDYRPCIQITDQKQQSNGKNGEASSLIVRALYDYTAEEDDEISIDPGDIITDIDQIDPGWWIGTTANGERGIFPSNFVEVCRNK